MSEESVDLVPAPKQTFIESKIDKILVAYIENLGEQEEFHAALAQAKDRNIAPFLYDLLHPNYAKWSITKLAKKHQLNTQQLMEIWHDYNLSKAMNAFIGGLPKIAADMVEDARSQVVECPKCDGFGVIMKEGIPPRDCPRCKGTGSVRKPGDVDSRKMILETVGWTGKKAALIQQTFVNANVESVIDDLERMQTTTIEAKAE